MKLLLSAYACSPDHGSEHAVGWNWVTEARRAGHQVWALVSCVHRAAILEACGADAELQGIRWVFPQVRFWPLAERTEPKRERTYNLLWQIEALRLARALHRDIGFDVVHHVTWGGVRAPTFLGALGIPLVVGPIGGGESSPRRLRADLGVKGRCAEAVRDLSNRTAALNPVLGKGLRDAATILVKTADTRDILPPALQKRCVVMSELMIRHKDVRDPRAFGSGPPRLLCVSRLIYWKGVHLAVQAFAQVLGRIPQAQLTIVGKGPEEARLRRQIAGLGLEGGVRLVRSVPKAEMGEVYAAHDLLVFPSLHDSSGNVVVEAFASGLPVMCLDLGGPKDLVGPRSGVVVPAQDASTGQVAALMADEIVALFRDPVRRAALSQGAVARAREFDLAPRIAGLWEAAVAGPERSRGFRPAPAQPQSA